MSAGGRSDQSGMQIRDGRLRVYGTPAHLAALSATFANYKSGHFTWFCCCCSGWHSHSRPPPVNRPMADFTCPDAKDSTENVYLPGFGFFSFSCRIG